ncbi:MAG: hypothetical protein HYW24_00875 [Candidatus Aenigmarchaeota archaeon]|nr:hypothetical protein [Candidatus Aenigmarchaeota archaeon]
MRRLGALFAISVVILSSLYFPILFSPVSLAQETTTTQPTSGTTTTTETTPATTTGTTATPTTTQTTEPTRTETTTTGTTPTETTTTKTTTTTESPPPETTAQPTEIKTTESAPVFTCPAPSQPPVCGKEQGVVTNFDDKGCVAGYICKEVSTGTGVREGETFSCPEVPPPTITCQGNEQLNKKTDDKGCVVGYGCVSSAPPAESVPSICPTSVPEKPKCDGSTVPVFDKGCLISYTCVPQGCREETDQSGFVRVVCKQERSCPNDEQEKLKTDCMSKGGNPIGFNDPSGCQFFDCRFDTRGVNTNPLGGHQSCPSGDEEKKSIDQCKETGLEPRFVFEGGCKIVKCSKKTKSICEYVSESEVAKQKSECNVQGLILERFVDEKGCGYHKCVESKQFCQRDVPSEAYKNCDSKGGEMIVKNDEKGCIVFSQCVAQGDENRVSVSAVEEIPDTAVLLNLALKLEKLKIELEKLSTESNEIAKYYASTGSLDEERYSRVSSMFQGTADRVDEIKLKLRDNADQITADDLTEIKHDIKYIKEVTLKDILYMMLSNSDDVKETLESSRKISAKSSVEEIEQNAKSCGTEGSCFDKAIRSCKPVTFMPEGRQGPLVSITGLNDKNCVLHITMQSSDMVPPGYTKDNFYMDCPIADYALGVRGPEDIIPTCEGPMAKFAKEFGGGGVTGGESFPPPEGGPGGCKTEKECATYCLDNYDDCKQWVKEHPAYGPMPSKEELRQFGSGRSERPQGIQRTEFAGPGGCKGPQECDKFCRSNSDVCLQWCDDNPGLCPEEKRSTQEFRQGESSPSSEGSRQPTGGQKCPDGICDAFERANPDACPQDCGGVSQQTQPSEPVSKATPVKQACVGCLNNGICDIGECSECGDCLRGERTITGEITRVRGIYG